MPPTRAATPTLKRGSIVVIRGRGPGRVSAVRSNGVAIASLDLRKEDGERGTLDVPHELLAEMIRPLATAEEAADAIARLKAPPQRLDERDASDRSLDYRLAVKGGDLRVQVDTLAGIYRRAEHEYPETQYLERLEAIVYGELAHVLGTTPRALKAAQRKAVLREAPPASLSLPDRAKELAAATQPRVPRYASRGVFAVDTKLALGESAAELSLSAQTGLWCVYGRDSNHGPVELLVVHADHVAELPALLTASKPAGHVTSDAATVLVGDAAVLADRELVDQILDRGDGVFRHHCYKWSTAGDGRSPVRTASRARKVVLVAISVA